MNINSLQKHNGEIDSSQNSESPNKGDIISRVIKERANKTLDTTIKLAISNNVSKEVLYIRHGTTIKSDNTNSVYAQSANAPLTDDGKIEIRDTVKKLKELGVKKEDIILYYSDDTQRIIDTLKIFKEEFQLNDIQCFNDPRLRTTTKYTTEDGITAHLPKDKQYVEVMGITAEVAQLMEDIKKIDNKYIILLGHKTNKLGAEGITRFNQENIEGTFLMPTGGILSFDVNGNNEYINYSKQNNLLSVNSENYSQLRFLFPNILFESSIDFQNSLNSFFLSQPTLFPQYLTETSPISLRTFCLANLIESKDYASIEGYYFAKCEKLSVEEKTLFLQNTKAPEIKSLIRKLFVTKEDLWNLEENELFSKEGQTDFYDLLKQSRIAYKEAVALQGNSLDPLINKKNKNAVLERKLYFEEEQESKDKQDFEENDSQQNKVLVRKTFHPDLFQKGGKYSRFVLRAHVGEGKSMYLSEFAKRISLEDDRKVKFVIAKNIENISKLFDNTNTLVCIDAFDEAGDDIKNAIKERLRTFEGQCMITTRYSEAFDPDNKTCILHFDPIETDTYIDSRFPENPEKATEVKKWIQGQGLANEVKGNPLLLNLIVLLASATDEDKEWMEKYEIPPYKDIKTKADLYENAVRLVLAKHKGNIRNKTMLEICMDRLAQHAFDIFSNNENPKIDKDLFDENLSVLFKSVEGGKYDFVHKSFYEFFLAKYLSKMENSEGNQKIYDFRDGKKLGNWNDWREFRPVVLFYGEMLAKDEKWDKLEQFLGEEGLMKGDDMFGESFFMGLEIIYKFPENIRNHERIQGILKQYEARVENWDIQEIIKRFSLLKQFIKNIGYIDNKISNRAIVLLSRDESLLADIGTSEAIEKALGNGGNWYTVIAKAGNYNAIENIIEKIIEGTKKLINEGKVEKARFVYRDIIENIRVPGVIEKIMRGVIYFIDIGEFHRAGKIYRSMAEVGTSETIGCAMKGAEYLINLGQVEEAKWIYETIAKVGTFHALGKTVEGAKKLIELGKLEEANEIYKIVEKVQTFGLKEIGKERDVMIRVSDYINISNDDEFIKKMELGAKNLLNENNFWTASYKFQEIAKFGSSNCLKIAIKGAEKLINLEEYMYAEWIYEVIYKLSTYNSEEFH